jgi:hypothetical protein
MKTKPNVKIQAVREWRAKVKVPGSVRAPVDVARPALSDSVLALF